MRLDDGMYLLFSNTNNIGYDLTNKKNGANEAHKNDTTYLMSQARVFVFQKSNAVDVTGQTVI